jgi:hypothetical protein
MPDPLGEGDARGAPQGTAKLVVRGASSRGSWPNARTDLLTFVLVLAFGYCLVENRSFLVTVPVLFGAVFCGVSPRMRGRWGWQGSGGSSLGGEFGDPFADAMQAELDGRLRGPGRESPPRTGSAED